MRLSDTIGLRPSIEEEEAGLDDTDHGEAGYHEGEGGRGGLEAVGMPQLAAMPVERVTTA